MIAKLTGIPIEGSGTTLILEVGGVGYKIHVPVETLQRMKEAPEVSLFTHLAVRENALDLYGFETKKELDFFELLISISGVGPKSGLAVLSIADVDTLIGAVRNGDHTYLTRVSGIGKKSAERIVLELKDKLGEAGPEEAGGTSYAQDTEVLEALTALGYSTKEARKAVQSVATETASVNDRLKEALKSLGK